MADRKRLALSDFPPDVAYLYQVICENLERSPITFQAVVEAYGLTLARLYGDDSAAIHVHFIGMEAKVVRMGAIIAENMATPATNPSEGRS